MSWDFRLKNPVTGETLTVEPHFMYGGNVKVEYIDGKPVKLPNDLAELNVTYNYSSYYYDATESFEDITETSGICDLDGMKAVDAIDFINKLIEYIENKYRPDGHWIEGTRTKYLCDIKGYGNDLEFVDYLQWRLKYTDKTEEELRELVTHKEVEYTVNEGDTSDYWEVTAANALIPLYQLLALSKMRPDGVWEVS